MMKRLLVLAVSISILPLSAFAQEDEVVFVMTGNLELLPASGPILGLDLNGFDGASFEYEAVFAGGTPTITAGGVPGYPAQSTTLTVTGAAASSSNGVFESTQLVFFRPFFGDYVTAITANIFGPVFFENTGLSLRASAGFEDNTRSFGNLLTPVSSMFEDDISVDVFGDADPAPLLFSDFASDFDPSVQSDYGVANLVVNVFTRSAGILGDINCDGVVDLLDVGPFVELILGGGFSAKADFNDDGAVDLIDVQPFVSLLLG